MTRWPIWPKRRCSARWTFPTPTPIYAGLERELLTAINELGIGPQGFGGQTTCLGLAIEQMPTHVAGLPVAVNVSCHVTRRASATL